MKRSFSLAAIFLTVFYSEVGASDQISSSSFVVFREQQTPVSGVTTLQTVTSKSAVSCGILCDQLFPQRCNGFVFQLATCNPAVSGMSAKSGTCQLLDFTSLASITFVSSGNASSRFYVKRTSMSTSSGTTLCNGVLRPSLTFSVRGSLPIYAVALLNNQLFITRYQQTSTNQIEVYDSSSLRLLRYLTVSGATGYLTGLAGDSTRNSLYVADYVNYKLFNVNLTASTSTSWPLNIKPTALSVNGVHNILVGYDSSLIEEYTPSGTIVRLISTGSGVWQAMEVNNGTWVASRKGTANYDVSLMSTSGQILRSYGNTTEGSGTGQVNGPRGLAVDKQGYVLLAEMNNNRVLAFNPTLSLACNVSLSLSSSGQITQPITLWLDESRDRLYVGEYSGQNRLLVFDNFTSISDAFSP